MSIESSFSFCPFQSSVSLNFSTLFVSTFYGFKFRSTFFAVPFSMKIYLIIYIAHGVSAIFQINWARLFQCRNSLVNGIVINGDHRPLAAREIYLSRVRKVISSIRLCERFESRLNNLCFRHYDERRFFVHWDIRVEVACFIKMTTAASEESKLSKLYHFPVEITCVAHFNNIIYLLTSLREQILVQCRIQVSKRQI